MKNTLKIISDFCQEYDMIPSGGNVIACVSGGADSMCLLDILQKLSHEFGFTLYTAHFNHNLRGDESDGDERFVSDWCKSHGIPLYIGSGDVNGEAVRRKTGIEETARDLRYDFFYETSKQLNGAKIATAHTADDNLETILMRMARGTGLTGLGGIPPVRGNIIRPLLRITRQDVESYNLENSIPHREDSSNASDDYARNRIRHHVIPVLREINPSVSSVSSDTIALLRKDEEFISSEADKFINENVHDGAVSAKLLLSLPYSVSSRVIRKLCPAALSLQHVSSVLALAASSDPSASISLPRVTIRRQYDKILFLEGAPRTFEPFELSRGTTVYCDELKLRFSCEKIESVSEIYKSLTTFLFKYESICGKITVRSRATGDFIQLSAKSGKKSLKKLFIDKKIPAELRASVPIICDESGPIAIPQIGCDIRVRPERGDSVLKVKVEEITSL
jgi:tRNA(Ile)-lysidine synthase